MKPIYKLDTLAPDGKIGVVALGTDFNIENDLRKMLPPTVSCFFSRVRNVNPCTIENLRKMAPGITAAADAILPGTDLDACIYGCTSGTIAIGNDKITEHIQKARPGVPVTNPVTAVLAAFKALKAKKITILTPYLESVNDEVATFFTSQGMKVLNIGGFGFDNDTTMTFISPADIKRAALKICNPNADLIFITCTSLRVSSVLDEIEKKLGKPVVCSNQALAWHSLKLVGYSKAVNGFGVLMKKHL